MVFVKFDQQFKTLNETLEARYVKKKRKKVLFNVVRNEESEEYGEVLLSLWRILQVVFGNILCIRTLWL